MIFAGVFVLFVNIVEVLGAERHCTDGFAASSAHVLLRPRADNKFAMNFFEFCPDTPAFRNSPPLSPAVPWDDSDEFSVLILIARSKKSARCCAILLFGGVLSHPCAGPTVRCAGIDVRTLQTEQRGGYAPLAR